MIYIFLLGGLFLGWSFGRNNLSSIFGTAIGTRMVSFYKAAFFAALFIFLGVFFSSAETMFSFLKLAEIKTAAGAFLISIAMALTILLGSKFSVPVSMAQSSVGAFIGWNLFFHFENDWVLIRQIVAAWFYGPIIAALFAIVFFYLLKGVLKYGHLPLVYRDSWVRLLLMVSGMYSAYFLGANNMPAIAGMYLKIEGLPPSFVLGCVCFSIVLGVFTADKRVIQTVSHGLFPLSPLEALVVVFSCGLTLYCFSSVGLQNLLQSIHCPSFPLVPISSSGVLVGAIMGVGFVKGHAGFHWGGICKMVASWLVIPVASGLICWSILAILSKGGFAL